MAATTQVRLLVRSGSHTELHRLLVSQWWVNTCELTITAPPQLARLPPAGGVDAGFRPWSTMHGAWVLHGGWHHGGCEGGRCGARGVWRQRVAPVVVVAAGGPMVAAMSPLRAALQAASQTASSSG